MTTRDVLMSIVALAGFAVPAHATIAFVYCNDTSHCTSNSGMTFSTFGTAAGGLGDTMSSPITFVSAGLSGTPAIYVDASTGTIFAGYSNATTQNSVQIFGSTSLAQTINGANSGIQVTLPANTYAFAMFVSTVSSFGNPLVELGDRNVSNSNYGLAIPNNSTSVFFGIISSTPLSSLFIGNLGNDGPVEINSFETGGPAPTPEVSTFLSIGTGLVVMRFLRRRQQRRRQTTRLDPVFS